MKLIRRLGQLSCGDRLKKLGLFSPEKVAWTLHSNLPIPEGDLQGSQRRTLYQELEGQGIMGSH